MPICDNDIENNYMFNHPKSAFIFPILADGKGGKTLITKFRHKRFVISKLEYLICLHKVQENDLLYSAINFDIIKCIQGFLVAKKILYSRKIFEQKGSYDYSFLKCRT